MSDPRYESVASVPDGLKWKPPNSRPHRDVTVMLSIPGGIYKLIRTRATGEVLYYRLKDIPAATPKEQIDAEPEREKDQRFHTGTFCWFIDGANRWFCCEIVSRENGVIVLRPTTGWDADRLAPWPYNGDLEIKASSPLVPRIRKLKDRAV